MRCLAGFVLFVVLYLGSCMMLGGMAGGIAGANAKSPREAEAAGRKAGYEVVRKYHAVLMLASGAAAVMCCSIPTILIRMNERAEQRQYAEQAAQYAMGPKRRSTT